MREIAIWLGVKQVELFESQQPVYMDVFCTAEGIRSILCRYYEELLRDKKIIAIEDMAIDLKKELYETAKAIADGRLDTQGCIQLCKCLTVLTYHKTL